MCIIAIKPAHHKMIDESIIETMFENNPDGSGYMYSYNNKVHIEKGFMTLKELLNSLDNLKKKVNVEEIPLVLHFRISTSGKVDGATCHPFPITSDLNALRKTHVITNLGMAHNGVIYDFEEKKSIYSDTQLFVNKCVSYLYDLNHKFLHDDRTRNLFEPIINGSRLAFLDKHGNIYRYGEWCEDDGIFYSNEGYIPWQSRYYRVNDTYYSKYYYGDDDYYYYVKAIPKVAMTTPEKTVKKINERQETEIIDAEAVKRLSQDTAEEETKAIDLEVHAGHGQKREAERKPSYGDADYRSPAQIRASQARKHSPKRGPAPKKHDMKDVDKMLLTQSLENEFHAGNRRKR